MKLEDFWMTSGHQLEAGNWKPCDDGFVFKHIQMRKTEMTRNQTELFKSATQTAETKIRQARAMQAAETHNMVKQIIKMIAAKIRRSKVSGQKNAEA